MRILGLLFLAFTATTGCIYHQIAAPVPPLMSSHSQFQIPKSSFDIVGPVSAEGEYTTILGMVMTGGNTYDDLFQQAKKMGGDDLINYTYNVHQEGILMLVYSKSKWTARATAIKWRK